MKPSPRQDEIRRPRRRGMTLVELLLSLGITGLIGAAVSSMLMVTSYGTSTRSDTRDLIVQRQLVSNRLAAAIRGSAKVLEAGDAYVVLWTGDSGQTWDTEGEPNLLELRRIEWTDSGEIRAYRGRLSGTAEQIAAANTTYARGSTNYGAVTSALRNQASIFPGEVWATQVRSWTLKFNRTPAEDATLVSYELGIASGSFTDVVAGAAALRNRSESEE